MQRHVTYSAAIEFLYSLRWFGAKFGLTTTFKLAALAGDPQSRLRFIHVAGTNGKGSVCAMLESSYRSTGLRTGLFTSPHLVAFGERIQVNGQPLSESEVAELTAGLQPLLREFPAEAHPTFFEVVTVMALRHFAARRCDLVLWETGLGGRLDATNIVTPLASIITNIQFDHQNWLGETLASIAAEKAGIIKPNVPVITATDAPDALAVIEEAARRSEAPLVRVAASAAFEPPLDTIRLPLLGRHQKLNAAVALAAVQVLQASLPVPTTAIRQGLERVTWPGRLQVVERSPGQTLVLDGAHNIGGARTLAAALRDYFPGAQLTLALGILQDKDWKAMCRELAPLAERIMLVPVHSERTAQPHGLAEACREANPRASVAEFPSLSTALASAASDPLLVVAGSLYLIGEAMELLHVSAPTAAGERGLNEWATGPASSAAASSAGSAT